MREPTIARNYAEALLALARRADDLDGWGTMISDVAGAVQYDERLRRFLESPRVAVEEKNTILAKAFQDRFPRIFVRRRGPRARAPAARLPHLARRERLS